MLDDRAPYPGDDAAPAELLKLAEAYRQAALTLSVVGRRGDRVSRAPYRANAIHALELYLNAVLLHSGHSPSRIRGLHHDLGKRMDLALASGLVLRKRTARHLTEMATSREYLVSRYGPELKQDLSQVNRLAATLDEVASKVVTTIGKAKALPPKSVDRTKADQQSPSRARVSSA